MKLEQLNGQRVAIWGAGREGLALAELLRSRLPETPLAMLNDAPLDAERKARLDALGIAEIIEGDRVGEALARFEAIFKSPGVSQYRQDILAAKAGGTRFTSGTQLWFDEHPGATTICITGSKGKSTTASLVAAMLRHQGKSTVLAGNIGLPLAELFDQPEAEFHVIELSSYQTADLDVHPSLGVLLNLFPEHLDWHGSVARYYADKLRLFHRLGPGEAIINAVDAGTASSGFHWRNPVYFNDPGGLHVRDGWFFDGARRLFPATGLPLPGAHNQSNICAALSVLKRLGLPLMPAREAIEHFRPLPHRFESIGEIGGIEYIDDSISTIPQAAIEAMKALPERRVTVLLGGYDRELEYAPLIDYLLGESARHRVAVICMGDSGKRLYRELKARGAQGQPPAFLVSGLGEAVAVARRETPAGGVVLLSPAAPSYGEFSSFAERGEAFRRLAMAGIS